MYGHDLTTPSTKYLTYQTIQTIAPAQWRNTCLLLLFQILTSSPLPVPLSCVKRQFPPDKNCLLFSILSLVSDISAKLLWIQQHCDQDLDSCHPNIYLPPPIISLSLKKHTQKNRHSVLWQEPIRSSFTCTLITSVHPTSSAHCLTFANSNTVHTQT